MSRALSTRTGLRGLVVLFLSLPLLAGCGKGAGLVTGKVTYKGESVTSGAVTFYGEDDRTDSSAIKPDGTYTLSRAPLGPVQITVVTTRPLPASAASSQGPGSRPVAHPGDKGAASPTGKYVEIPKKYADKDQSGLTYTVVSGDQTHDIKLD